MARTYDEDEVAAILSDAAKRAAERPDGSGVTLAELEDVAREAGLDRALVRAAATKVDRVEEPARGGRWAGTSTRLTARVRVDGPVDLDELAGGLFAEMADRVGDPGLEREVGEDRVWQTAHFGKGAGAGRGQQLSLTLRPTAGDAELVLREDVDREATIGIALRTALGAAVGAIATFIVGDALGPVDDSIFLAVISTPLHAALGWLVGKRWWRSKRRRLADAHAARLRALAPKAAALALPRAGESE